jgi:hypothetical protein
LNSARKSQSEVVAKPPLMRRLLVPFFFFVSSFVHAQSSPQHGPIILKWDFARLLNPFNSTIQLGAEFELKEFLTIHSDAGVNSGLNNWYKKGIFITHNQLRKYKRDGRFIGIDLFYIHAKDYSRHGCFYDKNKRFGADYDSVTFIKNSPGLAVITGNQIKVGNFVVDIFVGLGARLVSNKVKYTRQTIHAAGGECPTGHYAWHNDRYTGDFFGGHLSFGAKLGYVVKRKNRD